MVKRMGDRAVKPEEKHESESLGEGEAGGGDEDGKSIMSSEEGSSRVDLTPWSDTNDGSHMT